ncbi:MAG: PEP-CTERM sorting domain-containing protein [Bryobacteraceae bacterium]
MSCSVNLRLSRVALVAAALAMMLPAAYGSIVNVTVNSDLTSESNNITGTDVAILAAPAWAPAGPGYEWISYAQTGCNGFDFLTQRCTPEESNPAAATGSITGTNPTPPTAIFTKSFYLPGDTNTGTISIWADDSARVYLDGVMVANAAPGLGTSCASSPVGCLTNMGLTLNIGSYNLAAGSHTLEIEAYQMVSGTPFGVMYTGHIASDPPDTPDPPSAVPEPASFGLMGLGFAMIGFAVKRKI